MTVSTSVPAPHAFAEPWLATGYLADLGGPVHWVEFDAGAAPDRTPLVLVHGLGGSHLNWALVGAALATDRRVVALDLPGFGLSPGAGRDTGVRGNALVLDQFVREVVGGPVVLVGNSMGGMISVLQAQQRPATVTGVALIDPAVPAPVALPDPSVAAQFLLFAIPAVAGIAVRHELYRTDPQRLVQRTVQLCYGDPARADDELMRAAVALTEHRRCISANDTALVAAARSLLRVLARPGAYRARMDRLTVPVQLIHGTADRLVPIAAARRLAAAHPDWTFAELPGVGHTPQLEVPDTVIGHLRSWLDANHL